MSYVGIPLRMIAFETTLASSYNKSINLRLQVSVGNLILELSTRCVRIRGLETRIARVILV